MNEVAAQLITLNAYDVWVGPSDETGNDIITWGIDGGIVTGPFWVPGHPIHTEGNCVRMSSLFTGLLVVGCDELLPPLCKLYN